MRAGGQERRRQAGRNGRKEAGQLAAGKWKEIADRPEDYIGSVTVSNYQ
jgi:hypothetical protein